MKRKKSVKIMGVLDRILDLRKDNGILLFQGVSRRKSHVGIPFADLLKDKETKFIVMDVRTNMESIKAAGYKVKRIDQSTAIVWKERE